MNTLTNPTLAARPTESGPLDRARVDLSEDQEFRYWTARFACTPEQLVVALKIVGVSAVAVNQFLLRARP